jgi:hypothetical protein
MTTDLTDDDKAILGELMRETIERSRFLLSPRTRRLKAILDKLDPPPRGRNRCHRRSRRASGAWC